MGRGGFGFDESRIGVWVCSGCASFLDGGFGGEDFGGGTGCGEVDVGERVGSFSFLFFGQSRSAVLKVFEFGHVSRVEVLWILYRDEVLPCEFLVGQEVVPVLRLNVEAMYGVPTVDIATGANSYDMCRVCEGFEGDWVAVFAIIVLVHAELDEFRVDHLLASDRVGAVFFEPWDNVH